MAGRFQPKANNILNACHCMHDIRVFSNATKRIRHSVYCIIYVERCSSISWVWCANSSSFMLHTSYFMYVTYIQQYTVHMYTLTLSSPSPYYPFGFMNFNIFILIYFRVNIFQVNAHQHHPYAIEPEISCCTYFFPCVSSAIMQNAKAQNMWKQREAEGFMSNAVWALNFSNYFCASTEELIYKMRIIQSEKLLENKNKLGTYWTLTMFVKLFLGQYIRRHVRVINPFCILLIATV